jgi:hypothetical protein
MEEDVFGLIGKGLNGQIFCWPDWNGLQGRSSVLAGLEWLGIEAVYFVLTWPTPNAIKNQKNKIRKENGRTKARKT